MTWDEEKQTYNNDGHCGNCDLPCGPEAFCSNDCYEKYQIEMSLLQEELRSEYPRDQAPLETFPQVKDDELPF
jgi:hypothetical protein